MSDEQTAMEKFQAAAAVQGVALQRVQTEYVTAMAVQKPRDIKDVERRVLELADRYPDKLYYSWMVRNKQTDTDEEVSGASIKLAMMLAREYGNSAAQARLINQDATHWLMEGIFLDLETGFTCSRMYRQRRPMSGAGRMKQEQVEDMSFQVGQSKAIRNAIVNSMPEGLIQEAIRVARRSIGKQLTEGEEGLVGAVKRSIKAFAQWGVKQEDVEKRVGKPAKEWQPEDLADLRGIYTAINEGQTTAEDEFGLKPQQKETIEEALEGKKKDGPVTEEKKIATDDKKKSKRSLDEELK